MNPKRVLVIDDEPGFTRLLKLTLERSGDCLVREENDGTQAWLAARDFKPDIIFLDIVMPKIDGGDVAAQIKADPSLTHVPIVFLSAIVSSREGGKEIGGFPFLAKPVTVDAIKQAIADHTPKSE